MNPTEAEELNERLTRLWNEQLRKGANSCVLHPTYFKREAKDSLLFVGLNPSFNEPYVHKFLKGRGMDVNPRDYFKYSNTDFDINISNALDEFAEDDYHFFKFHREWAKALAVPFVHLDIFRTRQTIQKELLKGIKEAEDAFPDTQYELFRDALEYIQPKAIVVANAAASRIFTKGHDPKYCPDTGSHFANIRDKKTPVFLSGMLTGGAMDINSRKRLFWHLAKAIQH